jgi:hypothetical protein
MAMAGSAIYGALSFEVSCFVWGQDQLAEMPLVEKRVCTERFDCDAGATTTRHPCEADEDSESMASN